MKTFPLKEIVTACCFAAIVACKPPAPPPTKTSETAVVEEKMLKFKSDPSKANMDERALADLNSEIKELEVREAKVGGAEKDEVTKKLTDLRAKYKVYSTDFTAAKVKASVTKAGEATGQALEKAGEAVKDAAQSVGDSFKSDKSGD